MDDNTIMDDNTTMDDELTSISAQIHTISTFANNYNTKVETDNNDKYQVNQEHAIMNPNCDFVTHTSDNDPIFAQRASLYTSPPNQIKESLQSAADLSLPSTSRPNTLLIPVQAVTTSDRLGEKTWMSLDSLRNEASRLKTFQGWQSRVVKPEYLVRKGFFYLPDDEKVQCFFCHASICQWEAGKKPDVAHWKHTQYCKFRCGHSLWNVPRPPTWNNPWHPDYETLESRLYTYKMWPKAIPMEPWLLAKAGFFYVGVTDHVRCFYCDGGLKNWEVNDDPWVLHAKWFRKCCYLIKAKEDEFVEPVSQLVRVSFEDQDEDRDDDDNNEDQDDDDNNEDQDDDDNNEDQDDDDNDDDQDED